MREEKAALNAALKTADIKTISLAFDDFVRSSNVAMLAKRADIDRSILYRSFRGKKGPRLSLAMKVLHSAGFQLIVKFDRQPRKIGPNPFGQGTKTTAHLKLRNNSKASAEFLSRAFASSDIGEIGKALEAFCVHKRTSLSLRKEHRWSEAVSIIRSGIGAIRSSARS